MAFTIMVQNLHGRDPHRPVPGVMKKLFLKKVQTIKVSPPSSVSGTSNESDKLPEQTRNVWHEVAASLDTFFFIVSFLFVLITTFTFLVIGML